MDATGTVAVRPRDFCNAFVIVAVRDTVTDGRRVAAARAGITVVVESLPRVTVCESPRPVATLTMCVALRGVATVDACAAPIAANTTNVDKYV